MNLRWRLCSLLVGGLISIGSAYAAGPETMQWTIDGVQREAIVVPPSKKDASGKAPVILAFHGHGDNMTNFATVEFQDVVPTAVVVYPQGLPTNPSTDPQGYGWIYTDAADGQRDLKFVDAMLATLRAKFHVDDQRIYAAGFSNGAMFTYVLWGTRAKTFAAFAAVAGRIIPAVHLTEPKPIIQVAGSQDRTVPYEEQLTAMKTARALNGTGDEGVSCGKHCTSYSSNKGAPIINYIHGGGHEWPDGTTEMIAKFFEMQSLSR